MQYLVLEKLRKLKKQKTKKNDKNENMKTFSTSMELLDSLVLAHNVAGVRTSWMKSFRSDSSSIKKRL